MNLLTKILSIFTPGRVKPRQPQSLQAKKMAAHEIVMQEIRDHVSGLSSQENRTDRIKTIEVSCNILKQMDIPKGAHSDLVNEMKDIVDAYEGELVAKNSALISMSNCLKVVQDR